MAFVRLFASARDAADSPGDDFVGSTVAEVLDAATERYGPRFAEVLTTCQVWVNGEAAETSAPVSVHDEVAVLPPVSGGAG